MSTEIIISNDGDAYFITVNGRATFEHASQLRNLAKSLENTAFSKISLNLANCGGMDSTFMGILAMLGLRAKKVGAPMYVYNAGELNLSLLQGLGLKKLFE
ncbi:MAG: STAS domain-containing protein, partial [Victivallales bacterium]|nr:STAS domain-containing protein [Victivallales bacterium]